MLLFWLSRDRGSESSYAVSGVLVLQSLKLVRNGSTNRRDAKSPRRKDDLSLIQYWVLREPAGD